MRNYETIVIAKPDVNEGYISTLSKKIEKVVTRKPGELIKKDDWGLKRLAYEIAKTQKGRYLYWNYSQMPEAISEIERHLKFDENILRFLTVISEETQTPKKAEKDEAKARKKVKKAEEA
ncbi:MAG TPA: 30S ribosomal protein S6 [Bdellovibrionota bacterium]|nr:30S ribosomal protein S6 [Bdellovibrionota bacterium]